MFENTIYQLNSDEINSPLKFLGITISMGLLSSIIFGLLSIFAFFVKKAIDVYSKNTTNK